MNSWPSVDYGSWRATCDTLHCHAQVLGKLGVELAPPASPAGPPVPGPAVPPGKPPATASGPSAASGPGAATAAALGSGAR